jgi:hypothetical protein
MNSMEQKTRVFGHIDVEEFHLWTKNKNTQIFIIVQLGRFKCAWGLRPYRVVKKLRGKTVNKGSH